MMRLGIIDKEENPILFESEVGRNKRWENYSDWEKKEFKIRKVKVIVINDCPTESDAREIREIAEKIVEDCRGKIEPTIERIEGKIVKLMESKERIEAEIRDLQYTLKNRLPEPEAGENGKTGGSGN